MEFKKFFKERTGAPVRGGENAKSGEQTKADEEASKRDNVTSCETASSSYLQN